MGIDVQEADAYLGTLRDWGFVNESGRITDDGRRELDEHKRGRRRTTAYLQGSSKSYYPLGLR
jgi:predicted transcriptional regulator